MCARPVGVEMQDLAGGQCDRRPTLDSQQVGALPEETHETLDPRAPTDGLEKHPRHLSGVERSQGRMDREPEARAAVCGLILHELVVARTTAETRGQDVLQHADYVRVEEGNASGGQLLEATDGLEMGRPAERL